MPYGNNKGINNDIQKLKKQIAEQRPDLNVDNLSQNDVKNLLVNEINKNSNIDSNVKDKINKGDIDGLKEDIINYLSKNKTNDGSTDELIKMLKDNNMEGLKNQLMGMLLGGMNPQKKNEVSGATGEASAGGFNIANLLGSLDAGSIINGLLGQIQESRKNDSRVNLLMSMRPFVSDVRQKSIDEAIKLISVMSYFENFGGKVGG
ncbi:MAG: hypothetical protein ACOZCL_09740 [Bacillota bacterium]